MPGSRSMRLLRMGLNCVNKLSDAMTVSPMLIGAKWLKHRESSSVACQLNTLGSLSCCRATSPSAFMAATARSGRKAFSTACPSETQVGNRSDCATIESELSSTLQGTPKISEIRLSNALRPTPRLTSRVRSKMRSLMRRYMRISLASWL